MDALISATIAESSSATSSSSSASSSSFSPTPRVAILREEGSNGDREMAAAFKLAGFRVFDVTMSDVISGHVTLESFVGIAFVGGFSFADVFGSAKGWAAAILANPAVRMQFEGFYAR